MFPKNIFQMFSQKSQKITTKIYTHQILETTNEVSLKHVIHCSKPFAARYYKGKKNQFHHKLCTSN